MSPTVSKLITLAVHPGSPVEEARTAAMMAVKIIHRDGLGASAPAARDDDEDEEVDLLRLNCYARLAEHSILSMLKEDAKSNSLTSFSTILGLVCWVFRLSEEDTVRFKPLLRSTLNSMRRRGLIYARRGRGGGYYLA